MLSSRIGFLNTRGTFSRLFASLVSKRRNMGGRFSPALQHLEARALLSGMATGGSVWTTVHNTPVTVSAYYSHEGNEAVTIETLSNVSHGTLTAYPGGGGTYLYTPDQNYVGTDGFTFKASDESSSANGTVTIEVTNQTPIAVNTTQSIIHDHSFSDTLYAMDGDSDPLRYTKLSGPAHGTLILYSSGAYSYTPDEHYVGQDSFTFKANDGMADSDPATETFIVTNQAPRAYDNTIYTPHDQSVSNAVYDADDDSDFVTYSLVGNVTHGSLNFSRSSGFFSYVPDRHYVGTDSFTFKVNDGITDSNTATVTIHMQPVPVTVTASGDETWSYFNESRMGQYLSGNNKASVSLSAVSVDGQHFEGPPTVTTSHDERLGNTEEIINDGSPVAFQQTVNGESISGYQAVYHVKWTISKAFFISLFVDIPDVIDDFFGNYLNYTTETTITVKILANGDSSTTYDNQKNNPYYSAGH